MITLPLNQYFTGATQKRLIIACSIVLDSIF